MQLIGPGMRRCLIIALLVALPAAAALAQRFAVRASWAGGPATAVVRVGPGFRCAWSGGGGFRFGVWRGGFVRGPVARPWWGPGVFAPWTFTSWPPAPSPGTFSAPLGTTTLAGREVVPLIVPDPVSFREFTR